MRLYFSTPPSAFMAYKDISLPSHVSNLFATHRNYLPRKQICPILFHHFAMLAVPHGGPADVLNWASEIRLRHHTVQTSTYGSKHHRRTAAELCTSDYATCSMESRSVEALRRIYFFFSQSLGLLKHTALMRETFIDHIQNGHLRQKNFMNFD